LDNDESVERRGKAGGRKLHPVGLRHVVVPPDKARQREKNQRRPQQTVAPLGCFFHQQRPSNRFSLRTQIGAVQIRRPVLRQG